MIERLQRLVRLAQKFGALAFPIRLLIGAFITLIAGSGLGVVAEYAAYRWALYYGIRPPLEGIPYLKLAVTGLTIFIFTAGAVVYALIYILASAILERMETLTGSFSTYARLVSRAIPRLNFFRRAVRFMLLYRRLTFASAFLTSVIVGLLISAVHYLVQFFNGVQEFESFEYLAVFILTLLAALLMWDRNVRIWLALISTALFTVAVPASFFHIDIYSNILRNLGYGGGLPIIVTVAEDKAATEDRTKVTGHLMLRTTTSLILFESIEQRMREIPLQHVLFIDHSAKSLHQRRPSLPLVE